MNELTLQNLVRRLADAESSLNTIASRYSARITESFQECSYQSQMCFDQMQLCTEQIRAVKDLLRKEPNSAAGYADKIDRHRFDSSAEGKVYLSNLDWNANRSDVIKLCEKYVEAFFVKLFEFLSIK
jgi:hypothetical protein